MTTTTNTKTTEELAELTQASNSEIIRKAASMNASQSEQGNIIVLFAVMVAIFAGIWQFVISPMFSSVIG